MPAERWGTPGERQSSGLQKSNHQKSNQNPILFYETLAFHTDAVDFGGVGTRKKQSNLKKCKTLTEKIKKAARLFDIRVLDHLIITPNGDYYSFTDNGLV